MMTELLFSQLPDIFNVLFITEHHINRPLTLFSFSLGDIIPSHSTSGEPGLLEAISM